MTSCLARRSVPFLLLFSLAVSTLYSQERQGEVPRGGDELQLRTDEPPRGDELKVRGDELKVRGDELKVRGDSDEDVQRRDDGPELRNDLPKRRDDARGLRDEAQVRGLDVRKARDATASQRGPAMEPAADPTFLRGDANRDSFVDIGDASFILAYLFEGGREPRCVTAADADDNETIDLSDVLRLLTKLFLGGVDLPAPNRRPGLDPTPGLPCGGAGGDAEPEREPSQVPRPEEEALRDAAELGTVRLDLELAGDTVRVIGARVLEGAFVAQEAVRGEFVYEVCDATGECLGVGTFADPRVLRGARGDEDDHSYHRVDRGIVAVKFSGASLSNRSLDDVLVRVHKRTAAGAALKRINAEVLTQERGRGLVEISSTSRTHVARYLAPAMDRFVQGSVVQFSYDATVTKLLDTGSNSQRKNLVIIGDGFGLWEQEEYNDLVEEKLMDGVFSRDLFLECKNAFNIHRINAPSVDSGVTEAVHAQYETQYIAKPDQNNLREGIIFISVPGYSANLILLSGGNRSLQYVNDQFAQITFDKPDLCGNDAEHKFTVRMILDDDGRGKLWVGAPPALPGPEGEFSVWFESSGPSGGPPVRGHALDFMKVADGELHEKNTPLGYIRTGQWDYCWMQGACDTWSKTTEILELVPEWDYVLIFLNDEGGGGCGGNGVQVVTKGTSSDTIAHEFGHGIGGLGDEYVKPREYTKDTRPSSPNLDNTTDRDEIKWRHWISPSTPLPTTKTVLMDANQHCGAFEGGGSYSIGIYRPVHNCRMKSSSKEFCPVCYAQMREVLYPSQNLNFTRSYTGDFNGDGKDDLVQHSDRTLALFLSDGKKLVPTYFVTDRVPGGWKIRRHDQYFVGDYNNDGRADLFVFNGEDWNQEYLGCLRSTGESFVRTARYDDAMPSWQFRPHDRFLVGDFNGDGKDDLYAFNGSDWGHIYLGMLRSTGTGLTVTRRYDDNAPGWIMASGDRHYVGDFNGDGKDDLYLQNTTSWNTKYVGMLRSGGASLSTLVVYSDTLDGWIMGEHDELHVGDFNGNGRDDLYVFNGRDWNSHYLGMFRANAASVDWIKLYTNTIPGWDLEEWDRFKVADIDGDGDEDLYVQNVSDWNVEYYGLLRSTGSALSGKFLEGPIGLWGLGQYDVLLPADFDGDGKDDLFVRDPWWFGMLRSTGNNLAFERKYYHWIHNFLYYGPLGHSTSSISQEAG